MKLEVEIIMVVRFLHLLLSWTHFLLSLRYHLLEGWCLIHRHTNIIREAHIYLTKWTFESLYAIDDLYLDDVWFQLHVVFVGLCGDLE